MWGRTYCQYLRILLFQTLSYPHDMIIAGIYLFVIQCLKAPVGNSIAIVMLTMFIQLFSTISNTVYLHSKQKTIGVLCRLFKLFTVENIL